jgi:hypothetical protein
MLERDETNLVFPGHDTEKRSVRRFKLLVVAGLAALSIVYLARGFFIAFIDSNDVWRRWLEERFVLGGHLDAQVAASFARRGVVYPPWSYFAGLFMFWPPWPQVRVWCALINFASLIWIVRFVAAYTHDHPTLDRILLVLSVTAIGATCTTIGVGNYPVIVVALLVGAFQAEQAGRPILSGLLMGLELLKPQLSGPFLLVALVRGRFRALTTAAIYVLGATIAIWVISGVTQSGCSSSRWA